MAKLIFYPWDWKAENLAAKSEPLRRLRTTEGKGIISYVAEDAFLRQWGLGELGKLLSGSAEFKGWQRILGQDLTISWVEQLMQSFSLFGQDDQILISEAHNISPKVQQFMQELAPRYDTGLMLLVFGKNSSFADKITVIEKLELAEARFWELRRLARSFADDLELLLTEAALEIFLARVEPNAYDYYQQMVNIKLSFAEFVQGKKEITESMLEELLPFQHFDQFLLADLFSQKKFKEFFRHLDKYKHQSSEEWIRFFSFMQGYILKLYDVSYLNGKERLNAHEQKILRFSKNWKQDDLKRGMRYFSELEIKAKQQDPWPSYDFFLKSIT